MPFPFQIQRLARLFQKRLGILGHIPLTLLEDVTPTIELWEPGDPENHFLRAESLMVAQAAVGPFAGEFSRVSLLNSPQSNRLVVVERLHIFSASHYGLVTHALAVSGNNPTRDGRLSPGSPNGSFLTTAVQVQGAHTAAAELTLANLPSFGAGGSAAITDGWVLPPGFALQVEGTSVNAGVEAAFWWREVPLAPQELTSG